MGRNAGIFILHTYLSNRPVVVQDSSQHCYHRRSTPELVTPIFASDYDGIEEVGATKPGNGIFCVVYRIATTASPNFSSPYDPL